MVMTINIETLGLKNAIEKIEGFSDRRMNSVIATALTKTAVDVRDDIKARLPAIFDRPTPYTLNGIFMKGANANKLEARVWFNNEFKGNKIPQGRYLYPQVEGGTRGVKRFEKALQAKGSMPMGTFAVPTKFAKRDAYGGVSNGQIQQIISQAGTELLSGYNRSISADKMRRKRAMDKAGGQYVAVPKQRGKLKPGIYLAEGKSFGRMGYGRNGRLKPIFLFKSQVHYRKQFYFYDMAQKTFSARFNGHLSNAVEASMQRLLARQSA